MKEYDIVIVGAGPGGSTAAKEAAEKGLKTVGGMGMLVHQGAISFQLWTGRQPSIKTMRKALNQALEQREKIA